MIKTHDVIIIGAGFTGLSAGLELSKKGKAVLVVESDSSPGGLAGNMSFKNGAIVEKFYHHWFTSDEFIAHLIKQLNLEERIITRKSRTGIYYNKQIWRFSSPIELLRFTPLPLWDRLRLGLVIIRVRMLKNWRPLEHLSIREWLEPLCGKNVFRIVWEPLIKSKFSIFAERVNAVWMWNKLLLRGGTRDKSGSERLMSFRGGFGSLAKEIAKCIEQNRGQILYNSKVTRVRHDGKRVTAVIVGNQEYYGKQVLITTALPQAADILEGAANKKWLQSLRAVNYLGNICLILQLHRSLSDIYWLNVNDPGFPFVGVIEHTNFEPASSYEHTHIVYLSKYLAREDLAWEFDDPDYLEYALEHLSRMFPNFERDWIIDYHIWRAEYAQPIPEKEYSKMVPGFETPLKNCFLASMAQIYPEDRGTNYAVREGIKAAKAILGTDVN